jgi:isopentenyl diphosphate isomerase/L-lactate dehydrogenase-like FMN-dependent dehydrogenase
MSEEIKQQVDIPPYPIAGKAEPGNSDICTRNYLDSIRLELRQIGGCVPDTTFSMFGEKFDTPIMAGGMSPLKRVRPEGSPAYAEAAQAAGAVCWTGMLSDEEYEDVLRTGAKCIRIIKPFADRDKICRTIEHDAAHGAFAFSMDIDHVFNARGEVQNFQNQPLAPQTVADLSRYAKLSKLPFIVKGVLSVQDAEACAQAGVAGIVVSHHQNLYPWSIPPLAVLPEIVKEVGNSLEIYVDCGMLTGVDVYKAMALGAKGVCVARPLRLRFAEGGAQAVTAEIKRMTAELAGAMAKTGVSALDYFDPSVLHFMG